MNREAMQLALEALELYQAKSSVQMFDDAVKFLRQAIEQAEHVHAVNTSQEHVDETAKGEHDTLGSEWAECVKLPIVVHVRKQRDGETHISTREGITPVLPDDLIMRGVAGEEYPIGRELFERTYTFDTTPPPRQPLTDEEIETIANDFEEGYVFLYRSFARAIESAHGIGEDNG